MRLRQGSLIQSDLESTVCRCGLCNYGSHRFRTSVPGRHREPCHHSCTNRIGIKPTPHRQTENRDVFCLALLCAQAIGGVDPGFLGWSRAPPLSAGDHHRWTPVQEPSAEELAEVLEKDSPPPGHGGEDALDEGCGDGDGCCGFPGDRGGHPHESQPSSPEPASEHTSQSQPALEPELSQDQEDAVRELRRLGLIGCVQDLRRIASKFGESQGASRKAAEIGRAGVGAVVCSLSNMKTKRSITSCPLLSSWFYLLTETMFVVVGFRQCSLWFLLACLHWFRFAAQQFGNMFWATAVVYFTLVPLALLSRLDHDKCQPLQVLLGCSEKAV